MWPYYHDDKDKPIFLLLDGRSCKSIEEEIKEALKDGYVLHGDLHMTKNTYKLDCPSGIVQEEVPKYTQGMVLASHRKQ